MSDIAIVEPPKASDLRSSVLASFQRRRLMALAVPAILCAYFLYVAIAFDVAGLAQRARLDNVAILLSDFISYKTHVIRDNRSGQTSIAVEGEVKGAYPKGKLPEWVRQADGETRIDLGEDHEVVYFADRVTYDHPEFGVIVLKLVDGKVVVDLPLGDLAGLVNISDTRATIATPQGRLSFTRNRIETFKYDYGWELFFFTLDSPFSGKTASELFSLALWEDRIDPVRSNFSHMVSDFWNNAMWRHGDVMWALFETVLMAFLGTMSAAMIAFPVAFLAASNFTPSRIVRMALRRLFDFVRGVDGLIWTIILSRAFGPGPLTGALAIMITDTGSFGKMFSEALENVDNKQIEGVKATGANDIQQARFAVMPQVIPVFLSQVLYYFESNTRSATVIGAIVGGGIGLLLTQAIITQKDWEEVSYYIVLIVLMVIAMDTISGWLRGKLIGSRA